MLDARLILDPDLHVADVDRRTFGSFVEHMGRCVYTGIFEPGHPEADDDGHRRDVLALAREMGVTLVRYPGGNFVSGYRWEDGVGPREDRPTRLDAAWHSLETNAHGLGEFVTWARKADIEVNLAMNLGTRGVLEALDLHEYCNHPGGTYWSDLRIAHGHPEPFGIRMWCLGNEMDGPWQMGHKTAEEYGRLAAETARALRMVDPDLELVACGSSGRGMPTFGEWEATVLELAYDQVDRISAHAYYDEVDAGDLGSFLASAVDMEAFISEVVATADHVGAKLRSSKRIDISFDEWNVWYQPDLEVPTEDWPVAPRIAEDTYDVADAVVVGSLLITLLRRSDRVTTACQAQLVNALAPIRSEPGGPAWRQTSFYPFAQAARFARGKVLAVQAITPSYECARFGATPVVHAVATHDPDRDEVVVFVVNRHVDEPVSLTLGIRAFPDHRVVEHLTLSDPDVRAVNTEDDPLRVVPRQVEVTQRDGDDEQVLLPPVSWNVVRLRRP
ncbi:alpha-N-arabinofuranosidase [Euzebya sp.]|uniref:arabinosylfuranosidase ArfA n=1 Tax=Euzebya sp. TaxID=1971409 RepID=UPI0035136AD3